MTKNKRSTAAANLASEPQFEHSDLATPEQRVAAWCQWFDLPAPDLPKKDGELLLSDDLLDWLKENTVSVDWIVCGDRNTTLQAIADELNARGMLTRRGGQWQVSNVRNLLVRLNDTT